MNTPHPLTTAVRVICALAIEDAGYPTPDMPADPTIKDLQDVALLTGTTVSALLERAEKVATHRADVQADQELGAVDWDEANQEWVECRPDEDGQR